METTQTTTHTKPRGQGVSLFSTRDLAASLVVFLVALPLSLGIALASGAPLMAGLIAAIVGGIVIGLLGGAPLQVSGPAAGLTVMVAGFVQQFGWQTTCAVTVGAGLLQLALGALGVAPLALGMSPAVIHGMLAAIGVLIALSQMHVMMGGEPAGKGIKALTTLPKTASHLDPAALAVGVLVVALLVAWPYLPWKRVKAIPAALAAVLAGTIASLVLNLQIPRVSLGGSLLQSIHLPIIGNADLGGLIFAAVALCFVASAESLLSAVATDKLHTGPRANLHKELMAQGVGNTLSGLLGGLPITGVVVRSTANITAGAQTRMSAVLHGVWVLLFVSFLPFLLTKVPLAALAGLLVYTGFKLVNVHHIQELKKRGEIWIYVITLLAIVGTNLLIGLGVGLGVALVRLLWVLTHVSVHSREEEGRWFFKVEGTLTFAGVPKLMTQLGRVPTGAEVEIDLSIRYLDHAGFEALSSWKSNHERTGGRVHVAHLEELWTRTNNRTQAAPHELSRAEATA